MGIVASRVAERFNRPAILLSEGDEEAKGSGRSIPGFDLLGAVEAQRRAPARLRRAPRRLRAAAAARAHPRLPRGLRRPGGGHAQRGRSRAHAARGRRRRRPRSHPRARRRAGAAGPARLRQSQGHAAAPRGRGRGAASHARPPARSVPGALRRSHVPGDPLQLRQAAGAHRARPLRRAAELVEERVQRRRERPGRGQRAASARRAGPRPVRHRLRPVVPGPSHRRGPVGRAARGSVGGGGKTQRTRSPRRARTAALSIAAAVPPSPRSPRWRPAASACSCSSPTSLAAVRCSAATCSRRSSHGGPPTCRRPAWAGSAKRWPAPMS